MFIHVNVHVDFSEKVVQDSLQHFKDVLGGSCLFGNLPPRNRIGSGIKYKFCWGLPGICAQKGKWALEPPVAFGLYTGNNVGPEGAQALAAALKVNGTLQRICLKSLPPAHIEPVLMPTPSPWKCALAWTSDVAYQHALLGIFAFFFCEKAKQSIFFIFGSLCILHRLCKNLEQSTNQFSGQDSGQPEKLASLRS